MSNKKILPYYDQLAKNIQDPAATRNKAKDTTTYDVAFVRSYATPQKSLLDLGSGTGLLVNSLVDDFASITAVELYREFSKFIVQSEKMTVYNENLLTWQPEGQFDIITLFGVLNYFSEAEARQIYKSSFESLKETHGTFIVKNQFGVSQDVVVDGYSEELKTNYFSEYRHLDKEKRILSEIGFVNIEVFDIYPPEYNRWPNTHFYAIVCTRT